MFKRVVLKLSGEALAGPRGFGIDADKVAQITAELAEVNAMVAATSFAASKNRPGKWTA